GRAEAATGDHLVCGQVNQADSLTMLTRKSDGNPVQTNVFWAQAADKNSNGLRGAGTGTGAGGFGNNLFSGVGVHGVASYGIGVHRKGDVGVYGESKQIAIYGDGADSGIGVYGSGNLGVAADTVDGVAIVGEVLGDRTVGAAAIFLGNVSVL